MGVLVVIALVGEVVAWITFVGGALCLLAFAFARMVDGTWEPTEAVVADGPAGRCVRWFAGGAARDIIGKVQEASRKAPHGLLKRRPSLPPRDEI